MNYLDSTKLSFLNKSLDGLWSRQQITMHNIANYSTPGYKSKYVDFENVLKGKLSDMQDGNGVKKSDMNNEIRSSNIIIGENTDQSLRLDGNNVNIEKENLELAKTQLQYMYSTSAVTSYFKKMRTAISEGKK